MCKTDRLLHPQRPIISTTVGSGRALNKLAWDRKDGKRAAMGGADGKVYVYEVGSLSIPRDDEWVNMQRTISDHLSPGAANGLTNGSSTVATATPASEGVRAGDLDRAAARVAVR